MLIWIIFGAIAIASYIVQQSLQRKFKEYSKVPAAGGMTGADVARRMLRENGIYDVQVTSTTGRLTDFYNPTDKTVNLSEGVYDTCSVAAAAVAAHECGHAVQHARAYAPLSLRTALVPAVSFASRWVQWVLLAGIILISFSPHWSWVLLLGIGLFALTTLFSFITLPVEIDASRRAVNWLRDAGITTPENHAMAVSALRSAAYTYVVAALGSLATLVYYVLIYLGGDRD